MTNYEIYDLQVPRKDREKITHHLRADIQETLSANHSCLIYNRTTSASLSLKAHQTSPSRTITQVGVFATPKEVRLESDS
jgi:hypothetical protein